MYSVKKEAWGIRMVFSDSIQNDEMKKWVEEAKRVLATQTAGFGVFVDMRTLKPLTPDVQATMQEGQKLFKVKGMKRSVVILANTLMTMQFKRIGKETGIYDWERYIDSTKVSSWEQTGIAWIKDGVDPDKA
jgi:hypothetical protein